MKNGISISDTEWRVMEELWKRDGMTIGEIREALSDSGWSDSTVKTLVRRLVKKGAVGADDTSGQFVYRAAVDAGECRARETKSLIDRIYSGSVKMLVANFVSDAELSEDEEKQLMRIIDKIEEGGEK